MAVTALTMVPQDESVLQMLPDAQMEEWPSGLDVAFLQRMCVMRRRLLWQAT